MNIPISKTIFETADFDEIIKPLKSGWVVQGPFVKEFEDKWCKFTGSKHSIAVSNCTTGLHLSLAAHEIGPGDEVIVPAFTWVATANVVEYQRAKPIFCDIDLKTFNLDVSKIEKLITPKTRAIIPVHLFGLSAEMTKLKEIGEKHNLILIEDAACGFAASANGTHVGLLGHTGCFSFHPRKAITTGEGGMITTQDDALAVKLRSMRDHGASVTDLQRHLGARPYLLPDFVQLGFNYRMTDIQGSIGSTQMNRAAEIHSARTNLARKYDEELSELSWLDLPTTQKNFVHGFQAYVTLFGGSKVSVDEVPHFNQLRNNLMDYLQKKGIGTRPGTHAVHMLELYRQKYNLTAKDFPNAYIADQCSLALPLFPSMTAAECQYVVENLRSWGSECAEL